MVEIIEEYERTESKIKELTSKTPTLEDKEMYLEKDTASVSYFVLLIFGFVMVYHSEINYSVVAYFLLSLFFVINIYESYKAKEKLHKFSLIEKALTNRIEAYQLKLNDIEKTILSKDFKLTEKDIDLLSKNGKKTLNKIL